MAVRQTLTGRVGRMLEAWSGEEKKEGLGDVGSGIARYNDMHDDVHVRFEDGSECVVHDPDVERLIPAEDSSLFPDEEQCAYFPGLVVHASTSVLRGAKWVRGKRSQVSLF